MIFLACAAVTLPILYFIVRPVPRSMPRIPMEPFTCEVLYDESHNNVWGAQDTGFYGYSGFAGTLVRHGLCVSASSKPLNELLGGLSDGEALNKILVLNVAKYQSYHPEETAEAVRFVERGGRLFVLGEHEDMYGSSKFQNALLERFGVAFDNDYVGEEMPADRLERSGIGNLNQKAVSDFFGLRGVSHLLSSSIKIISRPSGYTDLLRGFRDGRDRVIAAGFPYGRGRVALLGDSEIFWNGDGRIGMGKGENREFLLMMMEWLLEKRLSPVKRKPVVLAAEPAVPPAGRMFIDTSSLGKGADETRGGLGRFAEYFRGRGYEIVSGDECPGWDVRVVAGPLEKVAPGSGSGTILLFADSFLEIRPNNPWGSLLFKMGARNRPSVYADMESRYGFWVVPCFLTDGGVGKNYFDIVVGTRGMRIPFHRAGSLDTGKGGWERWLNPDDSVWGETSHPGVENRNNGIPVYDSSDIGRPQIAVCAEGIMVVSSSGVVANEKAGEPYFRPFLEALHSWIIRERGRTRVSGK